METVKITENSSCESLECQLPNDYYLPTIYISTLKRKHKISSFFDDDRGKEH